MHITEEEREEIAAQFGLWNEALQTGDAGQVAKLYAPDATLLPTISNEVRQTPHAIQDYFEEFLELKPRGTILSQKIRLFGDVATNSGIYKFLLSDQDEDRVVVARFSFVYTRDGDGWKIIEHHSSMMPEA